jgi:hypothetical protein
MLLAMLALALLDMQVPLNRYLPHHSTKIYIIQQQDPVQQQHMTYMYNQRRTLINESSVIDMGFEEGEDIESRFIQNYFGSEIEMVESWEQVSSLDETERNARLHEFASPTHHAHGDLLYGGLCDTILIFKETNGVRRHVLFSHLNENWGAFSTPVPNRTVNWGDWEGHFKSDGCTTEDLWWYLNHTNVSAIFTTTHQWLDHPKVFSLPLGIKQGVAARVSQELTLQGTRGFNFNYRTELLLLAQNEFKHRPMIAQHVIANFKGTIRNRYKYKDRSEYWQNLQRAKFILCPSGLGWDTYRAWEALILGTIPVLETYYRTDGFYRVFDDLPVLWVDHFYNVTPSLLETSYPKILARANEYNFAKLTKRWWVDFINSFRHDFPNHPIK